MHDDRRSALLRGYRENLYLRPLPVAGRLTRLVGLTLEAEGCSVPVGSRCLIDTADGQGLEAQVVGFHDERTLLMPAGDTEGLQPGAGVTPLGRGLEIPVGEGLMGRVIDATGMPIDKAGPLHCAWQSGAVNRKINPLDRAPVDSPFDVGVRSINGLLTLGRGQRVGLFAGSGVGKSALLAMMTQHCKADVTVLAMIGERGREVAEFVNQTLGREGMSKAVVVAVPADQPPLLRLQGAMLATSIAEQFRDAGRNVLLMVDSLTRYAQAQREIGLATGEPPTTKGYTPSVFSRLPQLVERAGALTNGGSITAIYTVLAEGDDQNDPVVDAARAILDGHIVLSRHLSDAAHYPAIDIGASVSRTRDAVIGKAQQHHIRHALKASAAYRSQEDMLRVGLYQQGKDPVLDRAIDLWPHLQRYLQQPREDSVSLDEAREQLAGLPGMPRFDGG